MFPDQTQSQIRSQKLATFFTPTPWKAISFPTSAGSMIQEGDLASQVTKGWVDHVRRPQGQPLCQEL